MTREQFIYGLTACGCLLKDGKTWYEHNELIKCFEDLELLEKKPKTGHWIYIRNSEVNGLKIVECSKCGKRTYGSGNYCPNCGARMVDPQESEE